MPEDLEPTPLGDEPPDRPATGPSVPRAAGGPATEASSAAPTREEGDRPCPVCGKTMMIERRNGIRIDACDDHGVWLDNGELEAMTKVVRRRLRRTRGVAVKAAELRGIEKGRARGSLWSLLFD